MCTAFRCDDIIDKAVSRIIVGIVVLHGNFHIDSVPGSLAVDDFRIECFLALVQVGHKFLDTACIVEFVCMHRIHSGVGEHNS